MSVPTIIIDHLKKKILTTFSYVQSIRLFDLFIVSQLTYTMRNIGPNVRTDKPYHCDRCTEMCLYGNISINSTIPSRKFVQNLISNTKISKPLLYDACVSITLLFEWISWKIYNICLVCFVVLFFIFI